MNFFNTKKSKNKVVKKLNLAETSPADHAPESNFSPQNPQFQSNFEEQGYSSNPSQQFNPYSSQYQAFLRQNQSSPYFPNQFSQPQQPNQFSPPQYHSIPQPNQFPEYFPNQFSQPQQLQFQHQNQSYMSNQFSPPLGHPNTQMLTQEMASTQMHEEDDTVQEVMKKVRGKSKGKKIKTEDEGEEEKERKRCYSNEEDIILAEVYVRVTDEAKKGCDQTGEKYWEKICRGFNVVATERSLKTRENFSLQNRMQRMKFEMVRWNQAIEHARVNVKSGWNVMMEMEVIKKHFMKLNTKYNNRPFSFLHVVNILETCSKFNFTTTRKARPQGSTSDEKEEEAAGNEQDDEYQTPPHNSSQHGSTHGSGHTIHSREK